METLQEYQAGVFSAHAEVVPVCTAFLAIWIGILRARGGSSVKIMPDTKGFAYSPRTRR